MTTSSDGSKVALEHIDWGEKNEDGSLSDKIEVRLIDSNNTSVTIEPTDRLGIFRRIEGNRYVHSAGSNTSLFFWDLNDGKLVARINVDSFDTIYDAPGSNDWIISFTPLGQTVSILSFVTGAKLAEIRSSDDSKLVKYALSDQGGRGIFLFSDGALFSFDGREVVEVSPKLLQTRPVDVIGMDLTGKYMAILGDTNEAKIFEFEPQIHELGNIGWESTGVSPVLLGPTSIATIDEDRYGLAQHYANGTTVNVRTDWAIKSIIGVGSDKIALILDEHGFCHLVGLYNEVKLMPLNYQYELSAVAVDSTGSYLSLGFVDGTVNIIRISDGTLVSRASVSTSRIFSTAFSKEGLSVRTLAVDGSVLDLALNPPGVVASISLDVNIVEPSVGSFDSGFCTNMEVSPSADRIAIRTQRGLALVSTTGEVIRQLNPFPRNRRSDFWFSKDGRYLLAVQDSLVIFNAFSGEQVTNDPITIHEEDWRFSPCNKRWRSNLFLESNFLIVQGVSDGLQKQIKIYDLGSRSPPEVVLGDFFVGIQTVTSPQGILSPVVMFTSYDGIHKFSTAGGDTLIEKFLGSEIFVTRFESTFVTTEDDQGYIFRSSKTGKKVDSPVLPIGSETALLSGLFDDQFVWVRRQGIEIVEAKVFSLDKPKWVTPLEINTKSGETISDIYFSNTGEWIAGVLSDYRTAVIWSAKDGKERFRTEMSGHISQVRFDHSGRKIVIVAPSNDMVSLWDVKTGTELFRRTIGLMDDGGNISFSENGEVLLVNSRGAKSWNITEGYASDLDKADQIDKKYLQTELIDSTDGSLIADLSLNYEQPFRALARARVAEAKFVDGNCAIVALRYDGRVLIWRRPFCGSNL